MKKIMVPIVVMVLVCFTAGAIVGVWGWCSEKPIAAPNKGDKTYVLRTLMKQCARWAVAAAQDKSPIVAVLHANYAAGYLWAMKDIATDSEIEEATGHDIIKFKDKIIAIQEKAAFDAVKVCPKFMGDNDVFLSAIAGEG